MASVDFLKRSVGTNMILTRKDRAWGPATRGALQLGYSGTPGGTETTWTGWRGLGRVGKQEEEEKMMGTTPQAKVKAIQEVNSSQRKEGGRTPIFPVYGEKEKMTPTFQLVGEPSQQILRQVLQALLQQARVS